MTTSHFIRQLVFALLCCLLFAPHALSQQSIYYTSPAWSPDGNHVAIVSNDVADVYYVATNQHLYTLSGHLDIINFVVWSPDGQKIATASSDRTARIWSASDGALLLTLGGYKTSVLSVAWSPDSLRLISASVEEQPNLYVWDAQTGSRLSAHINGSNLSMTFSPDGSKVAYAGGGLELTDAITFSRIDIVYDASSFVQWHPSEQYLVTSGGNGLIMIWEATSTLDFVTELVVSPHYSADPWVQVDFLLTWVRDVRFSPDGTKVMAVSGDGTLRVWRTTDWELVSETQLPGPVLAAAFSPDTTRLLYVVEPTTFAIAPVPASVSCTTTIPAPDTPYSDQRDCIR